MHVDPAEAELVSRASLLDAGLTSAAIEHRIATGRLFVVHRGVYSVVPPSLLKLGGERAALLACGPGAVLSHRSAATIFGLVPTRPRAVDVTLRGPHRRGRPGLRIHLDQLSDGEVMRRQGMWMTSPVRTLHDLAGTDPGELAQAVNEALVSRLVRPADLAPRHGRRGAAALRAVLEMNAGPTRSEAERRLLRLVERARLPRPETNARLAGYEVDALWRLQRLIVEVDGYAFHGGREAFEQDRRRDADLMVAGHRVLRVTWRQLTREPEAVAARLAVTLASS